MLRNYFWMGAVCSLAGCGSDADGASESGPMDDPAHEHTFVTDYASVPSVDALDEGSLLLEFPVREVPPQSDAMTCYFGEPTREDLYVSLAEAYQGKHGHHIMVMRSITQEKPGTVRDCSTVKDMVNLLPVIPAGQGGFDGLPDGMAMRVAAGTQLVLQQHYLNPTLTPLKVKDAIVLHTLPREEVTVQVGFLAVNAGKLSLPNKTGLQKVEIECEVPQDDMNVILLGPHMHEWGRSYLATHTPVGGEPRELLRQDVWRAEWRDRPPYVNVFDTGLVFNQGDALHVSCSYENDTDGPLDFPHEMCTMYGLFYPANERLAWICDP